MRASSIFAMAALSLAACSKKPDAPPSADAASSASSAAAAPSASTAPAKPATWAGSYTATPGTLFVPDGGEWSGVKFRGEDAGTGLGEGTLTITIDPQSGRAEGTSEGALGALVVRGVMTDDTFRAQLSPKDPSDGFTGTAIGTRAKDGDPSIKGEIHLSASTANVIRDATFSIVPSKK